MNRPVEIDSMQYATEDRKSPKYQYIAVDESSLYQKENQGVLFFS